jgi:hypothetical protein
MCTSCSLYAPGVFFLPFRLYRAASLDLRFSRRLVRRWLSSGPLHLVVRSLPTSERCFHHQGEHLFCQTARHRITLAGILSDCSDHSDLYVFLLYWLRAVLNLLPVTFSLHLRSAISCHAASVLRDAFLLSAFSSANLLMSSIPNNLKCGYSSYSV